MALHTIPNNIKDDGQLFGGMLKKRNTIEAGVILVVGVLVIRLLFGFGVPLMICASIFVIIVLMPAGLALVGIGDKSVTEVLGLMLEYRKMPEILEYRLPEGSLEAEEEKAQNIEEKLKQFRKNKEKKKAEKQAKKDAKKQRKQRKKDGLPPLPGESRKERKRAKKDAKKKEKLMKKEEKRKKRKK